MAALGGVTLVIVDFSSVVAPEVFPWWLLIPAFVLTEALVIHLPTRRSAHTVSASEIPLVVGLAFVAPLPFIFARMTGALIAYTVIRRQSPLKLAFNASLLLLESLGAAIAYHAVLGTADPVDPIGWLALMVAVAISVSLSGLLVSWAIALHDRESSLRDRSRELTAGFVISAFAGLIAVLWVFVIWYDTRAAVLLLASGLPVFMALRVYERLARRHDELGIAHALTKELEGRHTADAVARAGLDRVVDVLMPAAAVALTPDTDPITFFEDEYELLTVDPAWDETLRYHRDVCSDGDVCSCAKRILGSEWGAARSYCLVIGDSERGLLVVRPRTGAGTEITDSDHRMLEAIAAQLSSAMTRIEAVALLQREIREKQALVQSKDRLIASVSHELRTPLTGIIGFAELLNDKSAQLGAAELEHVKSYIATEAHDLGNIVEDLLTAARADLGALEVQARPVSTRTVIDQAVTHLRTEGAVEVAGPDLWVSADAPRVRQILRNLLSNAVKYGGQVIEVTTEPSNDYVVIRVVDDGTGVPDDRVDSIFEPYESAHQEPSQPGSLGLGLSISRTLAQLMGGDLGYHRIADHTEFRLRLPAVAGGMHPVDSNELAG